MNMQVSIMWYIDIFILNFNRTFSNRETNCHVYLIYTYNVSAVLVLMDKNSV